MTNMGYEFLDQNGSFRMKDPEDTSYLYFPLAGDSGLKSCVTPCLGGDNKLDQNTFLLQPVSVEDLHSLKSTRNFWCVIRGKGVWSVTGASAESEAVKGTGEEESELEAGLMWHRVRRCTDRFFLESEITSFVPLGEEPALEIMEVTIRNRGEEAVTLTPIAAVPIYGRSADNLRDHRHVTSLLHRIAAVDSGIEVTPTLTFDERGHRKNTLTYFVYGTDQEGGGPRDFCLTVHDFTGEGGSLARPLAVYGMEDKCPGRAEAANGPEGGHPGSKAADSRSSQGRGYDPWVKAGARAAGSEAMGALRFEETCLAPGEEKTWCVYMGIVARKRSEQNGRQIGERFGGREKTERALEQVKRTWTERVNVHYTSKDPDWDNYMYWVTFQPVLRRIYGCSFLPYHDYGKGGRGWRDLWQDCLALLIMEPDGVRQKLADYYGGVRLDGTNATIIGEKQGEFLADRNHITRVWMDHGFWPFQTTQLYIQQTGDLELLLEEVTYFKDGQIFRGEKKDTQWEEGQGLLQLDGTGGVVRGSILEHILLQNVTEFYDVGAHNHIRLRGADWNDGLDMAVQNGESVAFTAAYGGNLEEIAQLLCGLEQRGHHTLSVQSEVCRILADHREIYDSVEQKQALLWDYYESCKHCVSGTKAEIALTDLARTLQGMADWIRGHIRRTEWITTPSGSFFNGYYDNSGRQVEGQFPGGVRMMLTSQVFPIMFGIADREQTARMIQAADELLYAENLGGYRLNTDFQEIKEDMGRAFGFAYGHKENGAVFSHMAVMYANALYRQGLIREGHKVLDALYRQSMDFEVSRIYPGLPEYFSDQGRGMYPYLTGSASWLMMTVVTQVYGIRGQLGDLLIKPGFMREQLDRERKIGIDMEFAGVQLSVRYQAREEQEIYTEVRELYLDGQRQQSNVIPRAGLLEAGPLAAGMERREILVIL